MVIPGQSPKAVSLSTIGALALCFSHGAVLGNQDKHLPNLNNVRFSRVGTAEGLSSPNVTCVVEDRDGVIWLGTDSGLGRYDGAEIRVLHSDHSRLGALSSDHVSSMLVGPAGKLWVGTNNSGLNCFDPVTETNERFHGSHPLPGTEIKTIAADASGNLWVGTGAGLAKVRLSDRRVTVFEGAVAEATVNAVQCVEDGVWIGMLNGRLYFWNRAKDRLEVRWQTSTPITSFAVDQHDALWIGTHGMGLYRLANSSPATKPVPAIRVGVKPSEIPGKIVTDLHCDRQGHLWVATPQGLCRLDRANRRSAIYRTDPLSPGSLSGMLVNGFCEDSKDVLWIATEGGGASRLELDRFGFAQVRMRESYGGTLASAAIWGFSERRDGSVWVGTDSGLRRWHPVKGWIDGPPSAVFSENPESGSSIEDQQEEPFVQSLLEDHQGRLWMGTRGEGLIRLEANGSVTQLKHHEQEGAGLPHDSVAVLHQDAENRIWVGTMGGGVVRVIETGKGVSFLSAVTVSQPVAESTESEVGNDTAIVSECRHVTAIERDEAGRTWVASWEGLFLLDRDLGSLTHYRSLSPQMQELSSGGLLSLASDRKGYLWIGTVNSGLNRLDPVSGEVLTFDRVSHGLPDNRIAGVLPDGMGNVWVSTGRGLARLTPASGKVRVFGEADGVQRGPFNAGAAIRLASGNILLGGSSGFNVVCPDCLPVSSEPTPPVLAGMTISGEPLIPTPGGLLQESLSRTELLRLPFNAQSRLSIRMAPGDIIDSDRFFYRFRLEGLEDHWTIAEENGQAVYTGLSPGRYQFLAQTSNDGRTWSEEQTSLTLVISPPWYRSWWSWILFIAAAGVVVWIASTWINRSRIQYQRRMREQAEQQRDRAEAELARQLQHALILEQVGRDMDETSDLATLFGNALRLVADQFQADQCAIISVDVSDDELSGEEASVALKRLASFPPQETEDDFPIELQEALKSLLGEQEVSRICSGEESESDSRDVSILRESFAPEGVAVLRRTSFLEEINGAILLQKRSGKSATDLAMQESQQQMLDALSKQIGTAIAQWRVAEKERRNRGVLEKARSAAENANQAKSDFLAKMTHELRTPLNAILGFTEVMSEDPELNERQREVMAIINNSGEHLHEVINGVLDLAKIEAGKIELHPARFEMERMLRSMHKMLSLRARSKGLEFPFELLTALPRVVETDKSKVRQVLINLLGNAIKFTEIGSVKLVSWAEVAGEVVEDENIRRRPVRIYFEVRDTGPGIPEDCLDTLFDKYTQTETGKSAADSTGLGLTIAKAFAELLGGDIEVESEVGEGTTFRLSISCDEISGEAVIDSREDEPAEAPAAGLPGSGGGDRSVQRPAAATAPRIRRLAGDQPEVRILIAEDQLPNRLLLRKLLEPAGFVLREAQDGEAAVEAWREWNPDLILMDEQMPKMTGREATQTIVAEANEEGGEDADVPVIVALTAFALDQSRSAAIEAGCSDFLAKPFRSDELFGVIARNLPHVRFEGEGQAAERLRKVESSDAVMLAG